MEVDFEIRLINIAHYLKNQTYKPKKYHSFLVYEPKRRLISAPAFIDRIIHHAIIQVIEPVFDSQFIPNSFACRRGKGTHYGMLRVADTYKILAQKYQIFYALKCDIKNYFASIDHEILLKLLSETISCPKTVNLLKTIVGSYENLAGRGIPIGNLTSQLFANIYLNELDIYVTENLKEKNYFRYMDDFLILSPDKNYLKKIRKYMATFLENRLKLTLHPHKANIYRADRGVDFVGYFIKKDSTVLRKKTLRRYKKRHKKRLKSLKNHKKKLRETTEEINAEDIRDIINKLKNKLRASRNSLKGFLQYSAYEKLRSGAVKVKGIIIPKIFSGKKSG